MPGISGRKGERGSKGESGSCVVECNRANALDRFGLERWVVLTEYSMNSIHNFEIHILLVLELMFKWVLKL